ncbi:hypothetical protein SAMN04515671_0020 [Nakamurella panacisegetis]|uniref:Uncharacterized protein n=1 Tax=Nakamurella panacisegetis TaxID=1090615 RepID=A0A1H0HCM3_9ACTN|nr:hypothetical protein [Nakamurella panacisegetis]SDO16966.1 hypothetical protein SAMN04515671_0020 [Nakamurella panacisegetis]
MNEPSASVREKLAQATARRASAPDGTQPPPAPAVRSAKQPTIMPAAAPDGSPSAGNGTATYLLLDHYFGGSSGTFWTFDGTTWRAAGTSEPADEQGLAQVAFAANRVDMWWDDSDAVTVVRAWKYL